MKDGHYKVKTQNYVFDLGIVNYDTTYSIQYGNVFNGEGPCVGLTFDTVTNTILKLDSISYYSRCSEDDGTREMLMSILKLCIDAFPTIKRIVFNDVSSIDCDGINVTLSYYDLLKYGKTWYEKNFGAKAKHDRLRKKLDKFRMLLKQKPRSGVFSFYKKEDFETWHDYFKSHSDDCRFFIEHKKEIERVSNMILMYSEWYISSKVVNKYDISYKIRKFKKTFDGGNTIFPKNQRFTMGDAM